jgi:hypothetical protein
MTLNELELDRKIDKQIVAPLWDGLNVCFRLNMRNRPFRHFFVRPDRETFEKVKKYKIKILYILKTVYGEQYDFEIYDDTKELCVIKGTWT